MDISNLNFFYEKTQNKFFFRHLNSAFQFLLPFLSPPPNLLQFYRQCSLLCISQISKSRNQVALQLNARLVVLSTQAVIVVFSITVL